MHHARDPHAHGAPAHDPARSVARLRERLRDVEARMLDTEARLDHRLDGLDAPGRTSARNLLHYLALRSHDLRDDQPALARLGLSSLGRAEPDALQNVRAVARALEALAAGGHGATHGPAAAGHDLLRQRAEALLGPEPEGRAVRIMVTMPSEAATEPALVRDLLDAGMTVMRINGAHDGPDAWARMVEHLRAASHATGRHCRVVVDLEGPKLRTGPVEPGPRVVAWRVRRNDAGDLIAPALVGLGHAHAAPAAPGPAPDAWLPVDPALTARLAPGSELAFTDRPGRARALRVVRAGEGWALAETARSAFVAAGTPLEIVRGPGVGARGAVGDPPPLPGAIDLRPGDELALTADLAPGRSARLAPDGRALEPARVPITIPEAVAAARPGHRVLLDDGKAEGLVTRLEPGALVVTLTRARGGVLRLRADKGVNLPDTDLPVPALTPDDRAALPFVAAHADAVEFSFVRTPADLHELRAALDAVGGDRLGVVLKIETAAGFANLPDLLLAALAWPAAGVMIARGDLAVEVGYERLAEVQEEILWLCEAAHVPVVWATQVLESLAKKGIPSRSEITDAAMGERAECVMLNKGPYVLDAVRLLDGILRRMAAHQVKKRSMLRALGVARAYGDPA